VSFFAAFKNVSSRPGRIARAFLASRAVAVIFNPVQAAANPQPLSRAEEGYFVGADHVKLFYRKLGKGNDVVVFLHGGPGADIHDGGYLMDPLARRHVLIMYDQRGGGRSDLVTQPGMRTIDAEVRDLEALRQHFRFEKMGLVGLPWGAGLAAYYAAAHPERVSRIVFLSPMPVANHPFVEERERREKSVLSKKAASRMEALEQEMKTAPDDRMSYLCREHDRIFYGLYLEHPER
jgi:proline iminopeptidase